MGDRSAAVRKAWITRHLGAGVPRNGTKSDYRLAFRLQSRVNPGVRAFRMAGIQKKLAARSARKAENWKAYLQMMQSDLPGPVMPYRYRK